MLKVSLKVLLLIGILVFLTAFYNREKISRLVHTITLFDPEPIAENFQDMEESYPSSVLNASKRPFKLPKDIYYQPGGNFMFGDSVYSIKEYLDLTRTEGLLIIRKDTIIYEKYGLGLEQDESHISWSMAKSFTSTLIGIFLEKGYFKLDDPIDKYLDDFKGTSYEGVTIRNLLTMSSGVAFNEDYGDFNSDINRFGRAFAMGSSMREFAKTLEKERAPGTYNHYVSINTQMLGFLLKEVTEKSITDLCQEYIWDPMGMEHDGQWIIDSDSMELVLGGLNASLRDFSKLGMCYKNGGRINGIQVVPPQWVEASLEMQGKHQKAGKNELSSSIHGYGYQWWRPVNNPEAFAMAGIYNQYVYVDPVNDIIIAKLSANHAFKTEGRITKDMHFVMFDAMINDIIAQSKGNLQD